MNQSVTPVGIGGSAAGIQIDELRLSVVCAEISLALLPEPQPTGAPMVGLGRKGSYNAEFAAALARNPDVPGLKAPWVPAGRSFWDKYLESGLQGFSAKDAFTELVPLRQAVRRTAQASWLPGKFALDGFYYPFGTAVAITATFSGPMGLNDAVAKAFQVRSAPLEVRADTTISSLSMDALVDDCLRLLRQEMFGTAAPAPDHKPDPFTIVTVVRGRGADRLSPVDPIGPVFRALQGLTTWQDDWESGGLEDLKDVSVKIRKTSPVSHILFGRRRARAVWFPDKFSSPVKPRYSMSVLHRNLVFATLQTESLGNFVAASAEQVKNAPPLIGTHDQVARRATTILSRLWAGKGNTYRSWSVHAQLEQNDLKEKISALRVYFKQEPLN